MRLQELLSERTHEAAPVLVEALERTVCAATPAVTSARSRRRDGRCKVRFNRGGRLFVPWGYVGGVQCDPVEKKPFFHAYPGALAYSFGMLGCDLHCGYCQNWVTSQALRDPEAIAPPRDATPASLVADAQRQARLLVSTYNEPLITAEWAVEIFREARAAGLVTGFVSNGNGTTRVLAYPSTHRSLQGRPQEPRRQAIPGARRTAGADPRHDPVAARCRRVGGDRDAAGAGLQRQRERIARAHRVSRWRVTGHSLARDSLSSGLQDDRSGEYDAGHAASSGAHRSGGRAALRLCRQSAGRVGDYEHTNCHACGTRLISRYGYLIQEHDLTPDGACPTCTPTFRADGVPGSKARSLHILSSRTIARLSIIRPQNRNQLVQS